MARPANVVVVLVVASLGAVAVTACGGDSQTGVLGPPHRGSSGGPVGPSAVYDAGNAPGAPDAPPPPSASSDSGVAPGTPVTKDSGGGGSDPAQICADTINMYRATVGLAPYARWTDGETCVDGQAQADSQSGTAHSAFGQCGESAQNECPGWPGTPATMIKDCLAAMWSEGPGGGHYENMTGSYAKVACGYYSTSDGSVWATQNFE